MCVISALSKDAVELYGNVLTRQSILETKSKQLRIWVLAVTANIRTLNHILGHNSSEVILISTRRCCEAIEGGSRRRQIRICDHRKLSSLALDLLDGNPGYHHGAHGNIR